MTVEQNRTTARRFFEEVIGKRQLGLLDELCAPKYANHGYGSFDGPLNREETKLALAAFHTGFPDLSITIEDMFSAGDQIVTRLTARGTHSGSFMGIPPTGKSFAVPGIVIFRFSDGKIVEDWPIVDQLAMMRQLGAIPAMGQTREAGA